MDLGTCTVETGLLKKHPCGQKAVSKCANCEQSICAKHAVGQMSAGKKIFLCPDCAKAWKDMGEVPATPAAAPAAKKPAEAPKAAHAPIPHAAPAPKPAAAAPKPAPKPVAAAKPAAGKPELAIDQTGPLNFKPAAGAVPKPAPAAPKPEDSGLDKKPQLSLDDSQPLEFTPSKKPEEKK
jgi:hypothetical protein